jgi:hypothetical protein
VTANGRTASRHDPAETKPDPVRIDLTGPDIFAQDNHLALEPRIITNNDCDSYTTTVPPER